MPATTVKGGRVKGEGRVISINAKYGFLAAQGINSKVFIIPSSLKLDAPFAPLTDALHIDDLVCFEALQQAERNGAKYLAVDGSVKLKQRGKDVMVEGEGKIVRLDMLRGCFGFIDSTKVGSVFFNMSAVRPSTTDVTKVLKLGQKIKFRALPNSEQPNCKWRANVVCAHAKANEYLSVKTTVAHSTIHHAASVSALTAIRDHNAESAIAAHNNHLTNNKQQSDHIPKQCESRASSADPVADLSATTSASTTACTSPSPDPSHANGCGAGWSSVSFLSAASPCDVAMLSPVGTKNGHHVNGSSAAFAVDDDDVISTARFNPSSQDNTCGAQNGSALSPSSRHNRLTSWPMITPSNQAAHRAAVLWELYLAEQQQALGGAAFNPFAASASTPPPHPIVCDFATPPPPNRMNGNRAAAADSGDDELCRHIKRLAHKLNGWSSSDECHYCRSEVH